MLRFHRLMIALGALFCLSACASVSMQETSVTRSFSSKQALITFVRPRVFFGDGMPVNIWHDKRFVGSLEAGSLLQITVDPGEHLFLAQSSNWSYAIGNIQGGKQYFLKANIFPGAFKGRVAFGVAESNDERLKTWMKELSPKQAQLDQRADYEKRAQALVSGAIDLFRSGKVDSFVQIDERHAY